MTSLALSFALKEISSRNATLAAAYREWAHRLPPGPVSRLSLSMVEQRRDLGKSLVELTAALASASVEVEFETAPASAAGSSASSASLSDPRALLKLMAEAEAADHEFLATLAGAVLPASSEAAETLAGEADAARKRSVWAQDQFELLSML
jgi:hypothetical protein